MSTGLMSNRSSRAFGTNVAKIITAHGITQSELARQCGWPPARVNDIIHGRQDHRLGTVETVASVLSTLTGEQIRQIDLLEE